LRRNGGEKRARYKFRRSILQDKGSSGGRLDVAEQVREALALADHFVGVVADLGGVNAALVDAFDRVLATGQVGEDLVERGRAGNWMLRGLV
jgi:hypothetical protein